MHIILEKKNIKQKKKIVGSIRSVKTKFNMNIISFALSLASKSSWFTWEIVAVILPE